MNNKVQNINIQDIISPKKNFTLEEKNRIEELSRIIRELGIIEPIIVKKINGKYEIILGIDTYHAALLTRKTTIPAIIKEDNDSTNSQSTQNFIQQETNQDVINLENLSKINLDDERNEIKMNNETQNMNNNLGGFNLNQSPAFGGSFFPTLEDEPVNMNMPEMKFQPTSNPNPGLIDLTDLSLDQGTRQNMNIPPMMNPTVDSPKLPEFDIPKMPNPTLTNQEGIINIGGLQQTNIPNPTPIKEATTMDILNEDFGGPLHMEPAFNSKPTPMPTINSLKMETTPSHQASMPPKTDFMSQPSFSTPINNPMPNINNQVSPQPAFNPITTPVTPPKTTKDIAPVVNTIKDLTNNLELFGYKIKLNEEDTINSTKIIIEVEK